MFGSKKKRTPGKGPEKVYGDICAAFDGQQLKYNKDDGTNTIYTTFKGDDLPIKITISVDQQLPVICFDAILDFVAEQGSYNELAENLNKINSGLHFGAFILDPDSGRVIYRYHYLFAEYLPSKDLILSITKMVVDVVDQNDGALKELTTHSEFKDPMFN